MIVHVITGPPCAGKTTLALASYDPATDIIVDLDRLAAALGSTADSTFGLETPVVDAAFRLRLSALKFVREQRRAGTAWVVDTDGAVRHYEERTDLDPGPATCHARALADGRPASTHAQIDAWYRRRGRW